MVKNSAAACVKTFFLFVPLLLGTVLSSDDAGFSLRHGQQQHRRLLSCSRGCPNFVENMKSCGKWRDAIEGITSACNWFENKVDQLEDTIKELKHCNGDNPPNPLCELIKELEEKVKDAEDLKGLIDDLYGEIAKAQGVVDDLTSLPGEIDNVIADVADIETVAGQVADGAVNAIKQLKFLPDSALKFGGYLANAILDTFGEICVPYGCLSKLIGDVELSDVHLFTNEYLSFSTDISPTTCLRVKEVQFDITKLQDFLDQFSDLEAFDDIYTAVRKFVGDEMEKVLVVTEEAKPLLNSMKSTVNAAANTLKSMPGITRRRKLVVADTNQTVTMEEASLMAYEKGVAKFHELYDEYAQRVFQDRRLAENAADYIGFTTFKLEIEQGFRQDFILMASARAAYSDSVFDKSLQETQNIPVPGTFGLLNIVGSTTMKAAMPYALALEGEATAIFGYDTGSVIMSVDLVDGSVTASSAKFSTDLDVDARVSLDGFMALSFQVAGSLGICVGPTQNACLTIQLDASQESAAGFDALAQVNIGDDLGDPVPLTTMFTDVLEYGSQPECVNHQVSISAGYWQYIMGPAIKVTLAGPDACGGALSKSTTLYDLEPKILQHTMNNYCLSSDILPKPQEFPTHSPAPTDTPTFSLAPSQSPAPSSVPTITPTSAPSPPPTNPPERDLLRVDVNTATGHLYKLYSAATMQQALLYTAQLPTYCGGERGHLVTLADEAEMTFVSALAFDDSTHQSIWLGISDIQPDGSFRWVTGEPDSYREWAPGHPATVRSVDYATLDNSSSWKDLSYDRWIEPDTPETFPFVVEYDCSLGSVQFCDDSSQCSHGQACTAGFCTSPRTTNLALGASVTLDPSFTDWLNNSTAGVVDGDTGEDSHSSSPTARKMYTCSNPSDVPYVEIELPNEAVVEGTFAGGCNVVDGNGPCHVPHQRSFATAVVLFHYYGGDDPRQHCNQQVQLSLDGVDWTTVYSTGTGYGPVETAQGNLVLFAPFTAKYIRHYSGKSNVGHLAHFIEVEVLGWTLPPCSDSSQCSDDQVCTSGRCAPPDVSNLALEATVKLDPDHEWVVNNTAQVVDGNTDKGSHIDSALVRVDNCSNPNDAPYVEIELPQPGVVEAVVLFHFYGDARQYCNQKVQLSLDGVNWSTVYSTGVEYGPPESAEGHFIPFKPMTAKYVRHYSGRSTTSIGVHFIEVQVFGSPVKFWPCRESSECKYHGEICSSGRCVPPEITNLASGASVTLDPGHEWINSQEAGLVDGITTSESKDSAPKGRADDCSDPANAPYVEIELPHMSVVEAVVLFHRHDDNEWQYCNQMVQLSLDGIKWETVYSTGTDYGPIETDEGNLITFEPYNAKYIRHYSGRSTSGNAIHFIEVQAFGEEYCKDGVPSADGRACCTSGCSTCGDDNCPIWFSKDCNDANDRACLIPRPYCQDGVRSEALNGSVCCEPGCSTCAGLREKCWTITNWVPLSISYECCLSSIDRICEDEFDTSCIIPY